MAMEEVHILNDIKRLLYDVLYVLGGLKMVPRLRSHQILSLLSYPSILRLLGLTSHLQHFSQSGRR